VNTEKNTVSVKRGVTRKRADGQFITL